ncbi:MAG: Biopolymer transport protein ExbB [Stenotrophomonas maltophilia]|uniref:Biopolymer transport protein ExbB n=1 Tax=Stenotrophomonas maltophilia TaxID=40324 RepID=A0A7V8FFL3_STEMA|nr:MAG: Biopolymer transport protein ExbB [Stenotrophomonas maltophilia]
MYLAADWVVKVVMICLALASLATWTVLIAKTLELVRIVRGLAAARQVLLARRGLADAGDDAALQEGLAQQMLEAARTELQLSADAQGHEGIKERLASRLERLELATTRQLRHGTGVLASIGAVAPFVGLFGTERGIMNSFVGIAASNTTNLAVVAPGIAEALLATAMGLVAAIPAVVIYNHFSRRLACLRALSGDISASVQQLVSRDLDRGHGLPRSAG